MVPGSHFYSSLIMYTSDDTIDFDKYDEPRLHMERLLKAHLVEFDLPLRILLPLESAGITHLHHLVRQNRESLMEIKNLGKLGIDKLEDFLTYYGLSFNMK